MSIPTSYGEAERKARDFEHLLREIHEKLEQLVRTQYFGGRVPLVLEVTQLLAEAGYERAYELTELVITAYTSIVRARALLHQALLHIHKKMLEETRKVCERGESPRS